MKTFKIILIIISFIQLYTCSGAPPLKEEEVEIKNKAASYAESGNKNYNEGRYDEALNFFKLALEYNTAVYNEKGMIQSYLSMGKAYLAGDKDIDALSVFQKALDMSRTIDDKDLIAQSLNNMGEYYINKSEYDKALEYFQNALSASPSVSQYKLAVIHHNIGTVYKRRKKIRSGNPELSECTLPESIDKKIYRSSVEQLHVGSCVFRERRL